jgi:hypothetical protein
MLLITASLTSFAPQRAAWPTAGWTGATPESQSATSGHVTGLSGRWAYGYQWWLTTREDVEIWVGRGFGAQLLIAIPSRGTVAVVQAWNVFGGGARAIFDPLVAALLAR